MISETKNASANEWCFNEGCEKSPSAVILAFFTVMHQSIPPAPRPPAGLLRGICTPCQSRGPSICKFCTARGPGIRQPRGHSRGFDTHAVSYQNITTQKVLLEKKQIGSSIKDRNKLKRVVKACSRFYACVSSLLIKPELHSEIGAIDVNQRFLVIESNFCSYYLKNILSHLQNYS